MTNQVDQLPYYDPLLKDNTSLKMSDTWISSLSAFIETLNGYLSLFGIFAPRLTTDQRNSIQSPVNGQIIYNTTLNKLQAFENGAWQNLI